MILAKDTLHGDDPHPPGTAFPEFVIATVTTSNFLHGKCTVKPPFTDFIRSHNR